MFVVHSQSEVIALACMFGEDVVFAICVRSAKIATLSVMECDIVRSYWLKTNSAVSKQPVSIVPRCHDGFIDGSQCSPDGGADKAIAVRQEDHNLEGRGGRNRKNLYYRPELERVQAGRRPAPSDVPSGHDASYGE